jgi:hypothetical protein
VKQCADILKRDEPREPVSGFWADLARFVATIAPYVGWAILISGVATIRYFLGNAIWRRKKKEPEPELAPAKRKRSLRSSSMVSAMRSRIIAVSPRGQVIANSSPLRRNNSARSPRRRSRTCC